METRPHNVCDSVHFDYDPNPAPPNAITLTDQGRAKAHSLGIVEQPNLNIYDYLEGDPDPDLPPMEAFFRQDNWANWFKPDDRDKAATLQAHYGDSFLAYASTIYLRHHEEIDDIAEDFDDSFIGSFDTTDDFAIYRIEEEGWSRQLKQLTATAAFPPEFLSWDYDAINDYYLLTGMVERVSYNGTYHYFFT